MLNGIEMEFDSIVVLALELNRFFQHHRNTFGYKLKEEKRIFFIDFTLTKIQWPKEAQLIVMAFSHSPVQNLGSSLKSPQWSKPSQYLSNGRHNPLPLHANSEILHDRTRMMRFNKIMPQAPTLSYRMMIWKIAKLLLLSRYIFSSCKAYNYKLIINYYYDYSINFTRLWSHLALTRPLFFYILLKCFSALWQIFHY